MIEFRSVCKEYQGRRVIDMLSMRIEAKERVVLFGPSGCGKSTVLHLIAGLVIPDAGGILINDELVATAKKSLREPERRGVGMVFQDLARWPHMTVAENIEFGLRARRIPENKRRLRVKGMPLSNLDDALNMQLRKEIVRLHGDLGFTLVYVTHSRDEAEALGARTVFLRHGRIDDAASAMR